MSLSFLCSPAKRFRIIVIFPGGSDDIRRAISLAILRVTFLADVQFLFYEPDGALPDHFVGLYVLTISKAAFFAVADRRTKYSPQYSLHKVAEKMRVNFVSSGFVSHYVTGIDCCSAGGSDDFDDYDFVRGIALGYPAERIRQFSCRRLLMVRRCSS